MPFGNWNIVHYVIVNDVIVSHQFVIQPHPSLQSTMCIRSTGEYRLKTEKLNSKLIFSSLFYFSCVKKRMCLFLPDPLILEGNSRQNSKEELGKGP